MSTDYKTPARELASLLRKAASAIDKVANAHSTQEAAVALNNAQRQMAETGQRIGPLSVDIATKLVNAPGLQNGRN
jgi:type II secretory pathway pseudopilin PulG